MRRFEYRGKENDATILNRYQTPTKNYRQEQLQRIFQNRAQREVDLSPTNCLKPFTNSKTVYFSGSFTVYGDDVLPSDSETREH